jgi:hypothetical protein
MAANGVFSLCRLSESDPELVVAVSADVPRSPGFSAVVTFAGLALALGGGGGGISTESSSTRKEKIDNRPSTCSTMTYKNC